LVLGRPAYREYFVGLGLALVGQAIRVWAAGSISKARKLATSGPFAFVRNPLYIGSLFIIAGYSLMTNRIEVWAPIVLAFIATHWGAVVWEEGFLRSLFGETFDDYCRRVPRLIPRLTPAYPVSGFSLRQAWVNREQISALGTIVVVLVFALKLLWSRG